MLLKTLFGRLNLFRLLGLSFLLAFSVSCSKKTSEVTVTVSQLSLSGDALGGVMVWGHSERGESFGAKVLSGVGIQVPLGKWTFYAIGWTGPSAFEGEAKCGIERKTLESADEQVTIVAQSIDCAQLDFSRPELLSSNNFMPLKIVTCEKLTDVNGSNNCDGDVRGGVHSYRVRFNQFGHSGMEDSLPGIVSDCQSSWIDSESQTGIRLPSGAAGGHGLFRAELLAYSTSDCTGSELSYKFNSSFQGEADKTKVQSEANFLGVYLADPADDGTTPPVVIPTASLALVANPGASVTAGMTFNLSVQVQDDQGVAITTGPDSTATVTLSLFSGTGTLLGTLSKAAVGGLADFSGESLQINTSGAKTVRITKDDTTSFGGSVASHVDVSFSVINDVASTFSITTQPTTTMAGSEIAPVISIYDAYGNLVTTGADSSMTVSLVRNTGTGTLSGTVSIPASGGIADFSGQGVYLDVAEVVDLDVTAGGLGTLTSSAFNITHAPASSIVFSTQPVSSATGVDLTPVVSIQDAFGNIVTTGADATADITMTVGTGPGTLTGTVTVAAVSGVANFSGATLQTSATGTYDIVATKEDLSGSGGTASLNQTSTTFTISPPLALSLGAITTENVTFNAFDAKIAYTGDSDLDGSVMLKYCNATDNPGCDPVAGSNLGSLTRSGGFFPFSGSGWASPNDPGDVINLAFVGTDPDGVSGSPATASFQFDYLAPTYASISPSAGTTAGGQSVTISGGNFRAGATVTINGVGCGSVVVVNASTITCTTGASGAATGDVVVTNDDAQSVTGSNEYTYSMPPAVINVTGLENDGLYGPTNTLNIQITFDQTVNVSGTPKLTLETGGADETVNYSSGSGTSTLTFVYTVNAGNINSDLDYVSTTSLGLNGGTIRNVSSVDADLTLAAPGTAGSISANRNYDIDGVAPAAPSTIVLSTPSSSPGNDSTPSMIASGLTDGDYVRVHDNSSCSNLLLTSGVVAGGNVTFTIPALVAGSYTFYFESIDAAGNISACSGASVTYYYDDGAPTPPSIDVANGSLFGSSFSANFSGGTDAEGHFDNFYYTLDNTAPTCASASGASVPVPAQVTSGDNVTVRVVACDTAGNISSEASATYTWGEPVLGQYYDNAPGWNDYVADKNNKASAVCNPANDCYHGGQHREVSLPNFASCGDFSINDSLGVFDWSPCDDGSGTVKFKTLGFAPGKGLKDLLNLNSWKPFHVSINSSSAASTLDSVSGDPYGNTVTAITEDAANVVNLNNTGWIYTFAADFSSAGINITANNVSIVDISPAGAYIMFPAGGVAQNCNWSNGGVATPDANCMVIAKAVDFLYLSTGVLGTNDATNFTNFGVHFHTVRHSVVENGHFDWGTDDGVFVKNSSRVKLSNLKIGNFFDGASVPGSGLGTGIYLETGGFHKVQSIKTYNTGLAGVMLENSPNNKIVNLSIQNSGDHGLVVQNGSNLNTFGHIQISNISDATATGGGIHLNASGDNVFTGVAIANAAEDGIQSFGGVKNIFQHVTTVNNGATGYFSDTSTDKNSLNQFAAFNNGSIGIWSNLS